MKYILLLCGFAAFCNTATSPASSSPQPTALVETAALETADEIQQLINALTDADPAKRAEAACALGRKGHKATAAVPHLIRLMNDGAEVPASLCYGKNGWWSRQYPGRVHMVMVGRLAASALTNIADGAPEPVEAALMAAMKTGPDLTRAHAAWAMGAMDHDESIPDLGQIIRNDEYAYAREQATWALGAIGNKAGIELLNMAIDDPHASVREQAAWALGAIGSHDGVDGLVQALEDDNPDVREQAAWALGAVGSSKGVPALMKVMTDEDAEVREQAAWALGAIGSHDGVDGLVQALEDDNPDVREQAAWALGAIGDARAEPALMKAIKDPVTDVRKQALWALGAIH